MQQCQSSMQCSCVFIWSFFISKHWHVVSESIDFVHFGTEKRVQPMFISTKGWLNEFISWLSIANNHFRFCQKKSSFFPIFPPYSNANFLSINFHRFQFEFTYLISFLNVRKGTHLSYPWPSAFWIAIFFRIITIFTEANVMQLGPYSMIALHLPANSAFSW